MDPLTLATSFATIVSLLGTYSSERSSERASSYEDFMQWLVESNHQELVQMIEQNQTTVIGMKALLKQNHDALVSHLQSLDKTMAQIASGFAQFREVALWAHPQSKLEPQAISLLEAFYDSGAGKMLERHYRDGPMYRFVDGTSSPFQPSDTRFILDDLSTLVELRLLNLDYNSDGSRIFIFTREASKYVEAIRGLK